MIYVALLRGINVGGNNKVDMKQLKLVFEQSGATDVKTYINSGNVIFRDDTRTIQEIVTSLESAIQKHFGLAIKVLVRDIENIRLVAKALPASWANDANSKCDVMFLWEDADDKNILEKITVKPEIDEAKYIAGTILWRVDKTNVTRSGLMKIAGSQLYKHMTIRNCNTLRKLHALMEAT